jgi:hypothetical protein
MTITALRPRSISPTSNAAPAVSIGGALAVVAALAVGFGAAVIGNDTHRDWQAKITRFATQPAKPALNQTRHVAPPGNDMGS